MSEARQVKQAFEQGKIAEAKGSPSNCPTRYENKPELRKAWFDGYYQNYLVRRHQETFQKYGIKFP